MKGDFEKERHEAECRQTLRLWRGVNVAVGKTLADRWLMKHLDLVRKMRGEAGEARLRSGMKEQERESLAAQVEVVDKGFALFYPWGEISVWEVEVDFGAPELKPRDFYKKEEVHRFHERYRQGSLLAA